MLELEIPANSPDEQPRKFYGDVRRIKFSSLDNLQELDNEALSNIDLLIPIVSQVFKISDSEMAKLRDSGDLGDFSLIEAFNLIAPEIQKITDKFPKAPAGIPAK
jgi:hypothetical protein